MYLSKEKRCDVKHRCTHVLLNYASSMYINQFLHFGSFFFFLQVLGHQAAYGPGNGAACWPMHVLRAVEAIFPGWASHRTRHAAAGVHAKAEGGSGGGEDRAKRGAALCRSGENGERSSFLFRTFFFPNLNTEEVHTSTHTCEGMTMHCTRTTSVHFWTFLYFLLLTYLELSPFDFLPSSLWAARARD